MKTLIALYCFLLVGPGLHAQQPSPAISPAPLPSGELLKRAPDHSQWTVATTIPSKAGSKQAGASGSEHEPDRPAPRRLTVTKSGDLRRVVGTNREGINAEVWIRGSFQITIVPELGAPVIQDARDGLDPYYLQFINADFPGMQWISAHNYAGMMKVGTQDCMVFQGKVSMDGPRDAEPTPVQAIAYIDVETRLPIYMKKGNEESTYQFGPPPEDSLALPPAVVNALNVRAQRIQQMTRAPARPY